MLLPALGGRGSVPPELIKTVGHGAGTAVLAANSPLLDGGCGEDVWGVVMPEWMLAVLIPVGLLGVGVCTFLIWATLGTDRPVEHHSSMPSSWKGPEGGG
ncbi:hypothetical protein ACIA98_42070 [Streptomyces sp. NPDC051366]|uniref:hypothetical protein n=1 Tax=Streptomyces sp. NPDC051366 TaxID=3365652 RepID=UPI0037932F76